MENYKKLFQLKIIKIIVTLILNLTKSKKAMYACFKYIFFPVFAIKNISSDNAVKEILYKVLRKPISGFRNLIVQVSRELFFAHLEALKTASIATISKMKICFIADSTLSELKYGKHLQHLMWLHDYVYHFSKNCNQFLLLAARLSRRHYILGFDVVDKDFETNLNILFRELIKALKKDFKNRQLELGSFPIIADGFFCN